MREKMATAVSVIGGADGPTSIFIAGKSNRIRLLGRLKRWLNGRRRSRVEKTIVANPHTLEEVIVYLQNTYHATEIERDDRSYQLAYRQTKLSLVMRHEPELLGELAQIPSPEDHDEETLKRYFHQCKLQEERAEAISQEAFAMDFHVFEIVGNGEGVVRCNIDILRGVLEISQRGYRKCIRKQNSIVRDIYLYYGVSADDMKERSQRYECLVGVLSLM